ncbi:MAG: EAL domain-containing protein [Geminicoccaceae bacterium]|nr:EAL domain-containing protein [Geminicoccaceae bacterium]
MDGWRGRIGLTMSGVALAVAFTSADVLRPLERLTGDLLRHHAAAVPSFDRVALVAIDAASLGAVGRWPWPRDLHADLVDRLGADGATVIGFDILFAEPDPADPAADAALVRAVRDAGRVVLAMIVEERPGGPSVIVRPFEPLRQAARALGVAQFPVDPDGEVRRLFDPAGVGEGDFRPLASMLVGAGGDAADIGGALLPPAGALASLPVLPAVDVLAGDYDPGLVEGRIVLIGVTASGVARTVSVPDGYDTRVLPTVAVEALAVAALADRVLVHPVVHPLLAGVAMALLALVWPLLFGVSLGSVTLTMLAPTAMAAAALDMGQTAVPVVAPTLAAGLTAKLFWFAAHWRRHRAVVSDRRRAHQALDTIDDAVLTTDKWGVIDYANRTAAVMFRRREGELQGRTLETLMGERGLRPVADPHEGPGEGSGEVLRMRDGDGGLRLLKKHMAPLVGDARGGQVMAMTDITEEHRMLAEIRKSAAQDPLTGLPNRSALEARIQRLVERRDEPMGAPGSGFAVAYVDLDRFKAVNDGLGHAVGDLLLRAMAQRWRERQGEGDTIARIGGDEFAFLICDRAKLEARVGRLMAALDDPFVLDGYDLHMRASVGIARFPEDGDTVSDLFRHADNAMYRAKQSGGGEIAYHRAEPEGDVMRRFWLDRELRVALRERQMVMHYQPRFDLRERRLTGFESLVRWRHPEQGMIPPVQFIGFAEETGLICELGRQVVEATLRDMAPRLRADPSLRLSINTSVVQLKRDPGYVAFVAEALAAASVPARQLEIEVTESLFLDPAFDSFGLRLRALAEAGVHLSIDDFGTGYSSLAYLNRFPFSRIKIDRSFVHAIEIDDGARAIVQAIVGLGNSLEKATTAEGVEKESQMAFLGDLGCHEVQGFLLGRPQPLEHLLEIA